jgi:MFS family permease
VAPPHLRERFLFRHVPIPLGFSVLCVQVAIGIMLFGIFQQHVPENLGAGDAWGGYLLAAYGAARFISETPTGAISDRLERRIALLFGLIILAPAIASMSGIEEERLFLVAAAGMGIGTAFIWPATYAISADLYPPESRGKVVGFLNAGQLLGFGIGALTGAALVDNHATVLFAVAAVAIGLGAVPIVGAIPSYRGIDAHEVRPPLRSILSGELVAMSGLLLLSSSGVALIVPAIRPFGDEVLGVSFLKLTIALIPGVVLGGLLYVPAGHAADRFGRLPPFLAGQALLIAGLLLIAQTDVLVVAAVGGAIVFAGNVFSVPAVNAAIMDLAPPTHRGTLIGLNVALTGLGLAVGPLIGGIIADRWGPENAFYVAALAALITASGILAFSRRTRGAALPVAG